MTSGSPDVRLILTLEYDGTPFHGWAAQPGLPTIEAALREALAQTFASVANLAVAGRTDTGVHALANVASVVATTSTSRSRPTATCGTWCGASSGRCSS